MDINKIIDRAATAYPDGCVKGCWNRRTRRAEFDPEVGDTLALFIVREIRDVYDRSAADGEQVGAAVRALARARGDLEKVIAALEGLAKPIVKGARK